MWPTGHCNPQPFEVFDATNGFLHGKDLGSEFGAHKQQLGVLELCLDIFIGFVKACSAILAGTMSGEINGSCTASYKGKAPGLLPVPGFADVVGARDGKIIGFRRWRYDRIAQPGHLHFAIGVLLQLLHPVLVEDTQCIGPCGPATEFQLDGWDLPLTPS